LFRAAARFDVNKEYLKRYYADFSNRKIRDLLISGEAVARTRMVVTSSSLLIFRSPKVMQEKHRQVQGSRRNRRKEANPESSFARPPIDLDLSEKTEAELYVVASGIALARTFKMIDPHLNNPQARHWERSFRIFDCCGRVERA